MKSNSEPPGGGPRVTLLPQTRLGAWSLGLAVAFVALLCTWIGYAELVPRSRPTFFYDPLMASLIIASGLAGSACLPVGLVALFARGERSVLVVLSVLLGAFVAWWSVAELIGH